MDFLKRIRAQTWQVVLQVVKLGSDLGPITTEYSRKPWYKTQSRLKRANHIG